MPIHVDIRINSTLIEELHIGRTTNNPEDTLPDSVNTYIAVLGDEPLRHANWVERGVTFQHRYGDSVLICIEKAIQALKGNPNGNSIS